MAADVAAPPPDGDEVIRARIGTGVCPLCSRKIDTRVLLCGRHWSIVPGHLRRSVYRALADWQSGAVDLDRLRAVQVSAIDYVREWEAAG